MGVRIIRAVLLAAIFVMATALLCLLLNLVLAPGTAGRGPTDNVWAALCIVAVLFYLRRAKNSRKSVNPPAPIPDDTSKSH
jgi:hypothetical protein